MVSLWLVQQHFIPCSLLTKLWEWIVPVSLSSWTVYSSLATCTSIPVMTVRNMKQRLNDLIPPGGFTCMCRLVVNRLPQNSSHLRQETEAEPPRTQVSHEQVSDQPQTSPQKHRGILNPSNMAVISSGRPSCSQSGSQSGRSSCSLRLSRQAQRHTVPRSLWGWGFPSQLPLSPCHWFAC